MGASVVFDPPVTVEECRLAGRKFGGACKIATRTAFEQVLVVQLLALEDAFSGMDLDTQEALAAFDQAAWTGWEAGRHGDGTIQIPDYAAAVTDHQEGE